MEDKYNRNIAIEIEKAIDLRAADPNGKSDPYVVFDWADRPRNKQTARTPVIPKTLSPVWHHHGSLTYSNPKETNVIEFDVWDKDSIGKDDYLGFASIDIGKVLEHNKKLSQKFELPLRPRPETKKKTAEKIKGVLFVTLMFPDVLLIDDKEVAELAKVSKFGNDMLRDVVLKYNKIVGTAGTSDKQQILTLMRDSSIIDLLIELQADSEAAKNFDIRLRDKITADPEIEDMFYTHVLHMFDVNRDGTITLNEFVQGLSALTYGSRDEKAALLFSLSDDNGDGELSKDEIVKLQKGVFRSLQVGFKVGFIEGSKDILKPRGPLNRGEFETLLEALLRIFDLSSLLEFTADLVFSSQDKDKNGKISKEEYIEWYCNDAERTRIREQIAAKMKPLLESKTLAVTSYARRYLADHV
jgi:hypothetical protein